MGNIIIIFILSALLGTVSIISLLIVKKLSMPERQSNHYDDVTPPKFFITGDKHRNFRDVKEFCKKKNTSRKDVLIVLGDSGFNYYEDIRDNKLKDEIAQLSITLFCLHGNKECRPEYIETYGIRTFCGGKVYYEPKYPNIFFAIDGEIYTFEGKKYIVMGGAHSVDKQYCLKECKPFWEDEMPDSATKSKFEEKLSAENNQIFGIMTHTCPIEYLPTEMFMSTKRKEDNKYKSSKTKSKKNYKLDIDHSTEEWLGKIEKKIDYSVWYCGHYHIDKQIDKIYMMYNEIRPLNIKTFNYTNN